MQSVVARFYVAELKRNSYSPDATTVVMRACTNEANKSWAAATPQGELSMTIKNKLAADVFDTRLGAEFDIVFTPVREPLEPEAA